jgi:transposase-like protein
MAQHHLLSLAARDLADDDFSRLINSENEPLAYLYFMLYRWGSLTEQVCPRCGVVKAHMPRQKHKQWRCRDCGHDFSLKSGSLFDNSKLPYWKIIKGIYLFVNNAKGLPATYLSAKLRVPYDTAYLLLHKIRWSFWKDQPAALMTGEFDIDVVWVGKSIRAYNDRTKEAKAKRQAKRREKRAAELVAEGLTAEAAEKKANAEFPLQSEARRDNPKKQCILAISRRKPDGVGGSDYVIGVPLPSESYAMVREAMNRYVAKGSIVYSDNAGASVALSAEYEVHRVNHSEHYVNPEGIHTNFVESVFARWRRMEIGTYHRMDPTTLHLFFADCAWRENNRRASPTEKVSKAMSFLAKLGVCLPYKKYGDRHASSPRAAERRAAHKRKKLVLEPMPDTDKPVLSRLVSLLDLNERFSKPISDYYFKLNPQLELQF